MAPEDTGTGTGSTQAERDTADLAKFGYAQELKRELSTFSSFAVAFSYISPSTGIFTLFYLGLIAESPRWDLDVLAASVQGASAWR